MHKTDALFFSSTTFYADAANDSPATVLACCPPSILLLLIPPFIVVSNVLVLPLAPPVDLEDPPPENPLSKVSEVPVKIFCPGLRTDVRAYYRKLANRIAFFSMTCHDFLIFFFNEKSEYKP